MSAQGCSSVPTFAEPGATIADRRKPHGDGYTLRLRDDDMLNKPAELADHNISQTAVPASNLHGGPGTQPGRKAEPTPLGYGCLNRCNDDNIEGRVASLLSC